MAANLAKKRLLDFGKEVKSVKNFIRVCPIVLMVQMDLLVYVLF